MKKTFFFRFAGLFLALAIISITYSQSLASTTKLKVQPSLEKNISQSKSEMNQDSTILNELKLNEINSKAAWNFMNRYKNVPDAKWFKSSNGLFVAYFTSEEIQNFVYYNNRGSLEFVIRYYKEEKLPSDVRHLVKSNYYDFTIYNVTEVTRNDKIAYVVKMENKILWKTVKVVDGEMEVTEEYLKR